jgi:hypothetical protein
VGRVSADTNVLFAFSVMDVLLALSEGSIHDDHEHMAACVVRQPCTILTHDTAGFPSKPLAERGVRVADPDTYLCELADKLAGEITDTVVRLAGEKRRPPKTPQDLLDDLAGGGVPRFADKVGAVR